AERGLVTHGGTSRGRLLVGSRYQIAQALTACTLRGIIALMITRIGATLRFMAFALLTYYLPVALIFFGVIPFRFRFVVLLVVACLGAGYAVRSRLSLQDVGISTSHLRPSLVANGALSATIGAGLWVAFANHLIRPPTVPTWNWFFPFYVLVSSPAQE